MPSTDNSKSGNPAKKAAAKKAAPKKTSTAQSVPTPEPQDSEYAPTTWGSIGGTEDLITPSGQKCLVRRPGVEGLMKAGVLHNVDGLTALVNKKHIKKGKKGKDDEVNMASLMQDPKALDDIMHTVDRVVCHVVLKPSISMTPNDVTSRQQGVIYADMVDMVDKLHIFDFVVGGTRDAATFRGRLDEAMGSVEDVEGVGGSSE